jgi:hypothetical protein
MVRGQALTCLPAPLSNAIGRRTCRTAEAASCRAALLPRRSFARRHGFRERDLTSRQGYDTGPVRTSSVRFGTLFFVTSGCSAARRERNCWSVSAAFARNRVIFSAILSSSRISSPTCAVCSILGHSLCFPSSPNCAELLLGSRDKSLRTGPENGPSSPREVTSLNKENIVFPKCLFTPQRAVRAHSRAMLSKAEPERPASLHKFVRNLWL